MSMFKTAIIRYSEEYHCGWSNPSLPTLFQFIIKFQDKNLGNSLYGVLIQQLKFNNNQIYAQNTTSINILDNLLPPTAFPSLIFVSSTILPGIAQ